MRRSCSNARHSAFPRIFFFLLTCLFGRINPLRHVLLCPNRHVINLGCSPSNACTVHVLISSLLEVVLGLALVCGLCTREAVSLTFDPISGTHRGLAYHGPACLGLLIDRAWATYCG
jgi:hypothetical protein